MIKFVCLLVFAMPIYLAAQTDSLAIPSSAEDLLESYSQGQEEDGSFDYDDLFDRLAYLRRRPLDLNKATITDLTEFPFLTDLQQNALPAYRTKYGNLISIYELQAVPGFDVGTIKQLLPFVLVNEPGIIGQNRPSIGNNHQQVILRWSKQLENKKGYRVPDFDTTSSRYLGSADHLYFRYKFTRGDRISAGITAEKDPGEEFFKGSNRKGFDFCSAHLFIKNPVKRVKSLALGDYSIRMGQGLLVYQGFAPRKSARTTLVSRSGRPLRAFSSVSEYDFFRGAAAVLDLGKKWELLTFASLRRRDANLDTEDETDDPDAYFATSLQTSGLHRTQNELDDRAVIRQRSAGAALKFRQKRLAMGLNGLYEHLNKPLQRSPSVYNQYYFNGNSLLNLSLDYSWSLRNVYFFGETARSGNGALASINGLVAALDRRVDLALVLRNFDRDYQSLNAKPFAESSGGLNEKGAYLGLQIQPNKHWQINAYFDQWQHDWPRFSIDAPSQGSEWLGRVTYTQKRKLEVYAQLRSEKKEENLAANESKIDQLTTRHNLNARLHLSLKLQPAVEWRSRLDLGSSETAGDKIRGVSMFQEIILKPLSSPFTASTRFAIFSTGGYDVRFYSYERDVLNAFSIPAYYDRGTRFYLNLGYRINRQFRLEARYATTYYLGLEEISSGLETTPGQRRSEVRLQFRGEF
ncbi:MAG: helix-hairpin-helix domain-containing protein [Saprospiraceae bacterium]|nr:helix-hairpin-helix domain-containing protein [Saprospiraceae bacterium]MCF8248838.1 helix-hairpin-helix domain-containing protein [Saprospiraceae bacterium]MCF8279871.1 helix-hairpin-helix domain-containing protein [Bacteroidales bacterium]MCF8310123.1 helix-hairpin-helix domain-containing protein [Saprospiraceae bacterium]MCF8439023.1 helix-hairpin-helix domain-containing protein [Saprospiraceae bacterium]